MINKIALFVMCILFVGGASAESLKDKKRAGEWKTVVDEYRVGVKDACGKDIMVELDVESWKNVPADHAGYSMALYCNDGCLQGVKLVCGDADGKTAVAEKIEKVICRYSSSDEPKITLNAESKTVACEFSTHTTSFQAKTKDQLEGQL